MITFLTKDRSLTTMWNAEAYAHAVIHRPAGDHASEQRVNESSLASCFQAPSAGADAVVKNKKPLLTSCYNAQSEFVRNARSCVHDRDGGDASTSNEASYWSHQGLRPSLPTCASTQRTLDSMTRPVVKKAETAGSAVKSCVQEPMTLARAETACYSQSKYAKVPDEEPYREHIPATYWKAIGIMDDDKPSSSKSA